MFRRPMFLTVVALLAALALPSLAFAQSSIAGVVKDATGAVLPGVTVEASSSALIEKTRNVVTDDSGNYKIIDLRPGTYTMTFSLSGFNTVRREGMELPANFTASVNAELRVGGVEETITVSGAAPLVDVQSASKTEVLSAELLSSLPTARNFQTAGLALPALRAGGFDVGGSTQQQQGVVVSQGSRGEDQVMLVDGMNTMSDTGGAGVAVYHNMGAYQEITYQTVGAPADTQSGGVVMNMVPKTGSNQVKGDGLGLFANGSMQATNLTDELIAKGFKTTAKLDKLWDVNASVGFPVLKDRIWWFSSVRNWTYNQFVANQFYADGSQAEDDNITKAYTNRMTTQLSQKNKLTLLYDKLPRSRYHSGIENGTSSPEATTRVNYDLAYVAQAKWTSTLSDRLLVEAGYSQGYYRATFNYQDQSMLPSASNPLGAISHLDSITGITSVAPATVLRPLHQTKWNLNAAVSYVTGSHALKAGWQYSEGFYRQVIVQNGNLQQLYRNGVPYAVTVYNTPINARTELSGDLGLYIQDAWTIKRLTLSPGIRFEKLKEGLPVQSAPAGRFVPARQFSAVECLPCWSDFVPRLGAAYDLFGTGRTAIKGSIGRYMDTDLFAFARTYNPMVTSTDTRTWTDANRDDIAQDAELGPSTNANFGVRANRNPDPDIKRPFQMLYSVGVQQEVRSGISASLFFYRRGYHRLIATMNKAIPPSGFAQEYTPVTIADPRGNGQTLTVYNLNPAYLGKVDQLDFNSDINFRTYNGIDTSINMRLRGGINLVGGTSTGKFHRNTCEVEDPNQQRFCDATQPFTTILKLSGTVPLKYGIRASAVFQSMPGIQFTRNATTDGDIAQTYLVTRAVIPTLTLASVNIRLNEPGKDFLDRVNQLDLALSKRFQIGNVEVTPQLDIFNALNVSPVTSITQAFGSRYGFPLTVLPGRLFRIGGQFKF